MLFRSVSQSRYSAAFKEQQETAKQAGWFVSAISALVRPGITWCFFFMYAAVKAAGLVIAFQTNAPWYEVVSQVWDADDFGVFTMCLTFYFVSRPLEKYRKS